MLDQECIEEYNRRIHKVQDYIENHIDQRLSIEELSDAAGFSKYHFSRIFQSIVHESLRYYVNRIRMERSLFLLAHRQDKNITDIAYELGFTDSAIFSRAFKNSFGIGPREYRKEYSKNCKELFLISEYDKGTAKKEKADYQFPVTGKIDLINLEEMQVVYVRHTGTYETLAKEYARLLQRLFMQAGRQNLMAEGQNKVLAIYHDNPEFSDKKQFRTSLCLTVSNHLKPSEGEGLEIMILAGGLYAVGHFEIIPDQYSDAWNYMYQEWITGSGYIPRDSYPFEMYMNVPGPGDKHIVDIYVPIEPISF
ncbi:AraC family transcriptional regulator [Clostridium sp. YIM B02515]|uniref:AraC family transcriptional regulator n=1 Tax=Clostridium rhizosphaerae TaxID=2803861 RepID=A0ABS1TIK7_9CLOT|nr:GyrI-like domain-containing protein [Clostridium rhizosphaerae]MBL4937793.1 AraC family transcriptional regulator [Clostridium rhizosphaerae]